MIVVLMGVCGSGKTTVGMHLAEDLHWQFADADQFHPKSNVDKMAAGLALNDEDRLPWLTAIREHITRLFQEGSNGIVTCSALKAHYRRLLLDGTAGSNDNRNSLNLPVLGNTNSVKVVANGLSNKDPLNNRCLNGHAREDKKGKANQHVELFNEIRTSASELGTEASSNGTGIDVASSTERNNLEMSSALNVTVASASSAAFPTTSNSMDASVVSNSCSFQSNGKALHHIPEKHSEVTTAVRGYEDTTVLPVTVDNIGDTLSTHVSRVTISSADVLFVYLKGSCEVIAARMMQRTGHFMPTSLLQSQMETLEEPSLEENSLTVDISWSVEEIGRRVKQYIHERK